MENNDSDPCCPESCEQCAKLPYGKSIRDHQRDIIRAAIRAERVFDTGLITTTKFTKAEARENLLAFGAMLYGHTLASVLGLLVHADPKLAHEAAGMFEDMAANGGVWFTEQLYDEVKAELDAKAGK